MDFETRVSQPAHCFQLKNSPGKGEVKKADPRSFSGGNGTVPDPDLEISGGLGGGGGGGSGHPDP